MRHKELKALGYTSSQRKYYDILFEENFVKLKKELECVEKV